MPATWDLNISRCLLMAQDDNPEKLDALINLLNRNEKILIHCAGANRVSDFFMAYLIKSQGYTVNEAVQVGEKLKFSLPLEKLLDAEISLKIEDGKINQ